MDELGESANKADKMISEVITHVNSLEKKIVDVREALDEVKDLEIVNKLDIINLKNEIEKFGLNVQSADPKAVKAMYDYAQEIQKHGISDKLKLLEKDIDAVKKVLVKGKRPPKEYDMDSVEQRLTTLESSSSAGASVPGDIKKTLDELDKRVAMIEQKPIPSSGKAPSLPKEIFGLNVKVEELSQKLQDFENQKQATPSPAPDTEVQTTIESLSRRMDELEQQKPQQIEHSKDDALEKKQTQLEYALHSLQEKLKSAYSQKPNSVHLEKAILTLQHHVDQLTTRKQNKKEVEHVIEKKQTQLEFALDHLRDTIAGQISTLSKKPSHNINAAHAVDTINARLKSSGSATLKQNLAQMKKEVDKLQQLKDVTKSIKVKVPALEKQLTRLQKSVEAKKDTTGPIRVALDNVINDLDTVTREVDRLQRSMIRIHKTQHVDPKTLHATISQLKKDHKTLWKAARPSHVHTVSSQEKTIKNQQKTLETMSSRIKALEKHINALKAQKIKRKSAPKKRSQPKPAQPSMADALRELRKGLEE